MRTAVFLYQEGLRIQCITVIKKKKKKKKNKKRNNYVLYTLPPTLHLFLASPPCDIGINLLYSLLIIYFATHTTNSQLNCLNKLPSNMAGDLRSPSGLFIRTFLLFSATNIKQFITF